MEPMVLTPTVAVVVRVTEDSASRGLIIRLIIQSIRRDRSGSVWIDDPSNVSRPDPSGADQIDAEHQATDLMPERRQGRPLVHERAAGATAPLRSVGLYVAHRAGPRRGLLATSSRHRPPHGQPHHNRRDSVQAHATQSLVTTDQLGSNLECEHRIVL
jgi:hypothetical protein